MINLNSTKLPLICLSSLFLIACDPEFSEPVGDTSSYTEGDAIFTNYVAIGDSITAGYADSALYSSGQENSFPNVLATQFKTVGGGTFVQPLMNDNLGGLLFSGNPNPAFPNRLVLDADPTLSTPKPEPIAGTPINEVFGSPLIGTTFNNMGVPGAKSFHLSLAPTYGNPAGLLVSPATANPYYVRFSKETGTTTIMDDAVVKQTPTFFTLWIGNNDILGYATDGGDDTLDTITNTVTFTAAYADIINQITTNAPGARGVLINIPDVSSLPYFSAVAFNGVPLDSGKATALQAGFDAAYNPGLDNLFAGNVIDQTELNKRKISFTAGLTNSPIIDASEEVTNGDLTDLTGFGIPSIRQANSSDLITLKAAQILGTENTGPTDIWGLSPTSPLADQFVLTPSEITNIEDARTIFNGIIKAAADANNNFAFYDASAFMAELKANGINYGTGNITAVYASGGAFSLDGVHPTARGYAVIANEIIDTINTAFNATIPKVDPGTRTTIFLK